jgi:dTDP-4-dehydrorhamnose 3,5-epimerase
MQVTATKINEVQVIKPRIFEDDRGYFLETFHLNRFQSAGLAETFVQDNLSYSVKNALRGLHFQISRPQAKLIQVISGEIFDVAVDIRPGSSTFGYWVGVRLSQHNKRQMFIPRGFAHGFCVLSESAHVFYKCSDYYRPEDEGGLLWSDPTLAIKWPITDPIVSEKDARLPLLHDVPPKNLYNPVRTL